MVEISQTLDRGLRLLEVLSGSSGGLSVAEASVVLGVNRTIVYRLLATLEQHGLVRRVAGGRFSVGFGVLTLAGSVQPSLRQVAQPVLRSLAEDVGATAHLTIADGAEALAVAVVEPTRTDYHVAYRVGSRHVLERGAAGRAILGARTGSPAFVATAGELQTGASGVAAPVVGVPGVEASVGVIALGALDADTVGPRTVAAAAELAAALA
ncbi:helix-turn-helix domain-containing protein [Jiangella mangrovi]|uniref:DNA-binding IclR family transcriptional regulator n=1 Tax=Jiangella mangrovi TaxID=1524084 RepID=A0A7W9GRG9_9ACTN|nr:DNA-binding IclR family transcriptional regulator [Jiangella mangrovi]